MLRIASLERLVHALAHLPGVGPKSAQRMAYFFLKNSRDFSERVAEALLEVQDKVHECSRCFNYTDREAECDFCLDSRRDESLICVVEEPTDILGIESSGAFRGQFHVLHGTIAPLEGTGPKDLRIEQLVQRIDAENSPIKELILALDADFEGDTTVLYLSEILKDKNIRITRIAHGVPIGGNIDYIDDRTIGRALENRVVL